jgi:Swt1-like HEPN
MRSDPPLSLTTFGELSVIISANWDLFKTVLTDQRAVARVMSSLNLLRNPVAHCSPMADDEVERLRLSVKDWFRLIG